MVTTATSLQNTYLCFNGIFKEYFFYFFSEEVFSKYHIDNCFSFFLGTVWLAMYLNVEAPRRHC